MYQRASNHGRPDYLHTFNGRWRLKDVVLNDTLPRYVSDHNVWRGGGHPKLPAEPSADAWHRSSTFTTSGVSSELLPDETNETNFQNDISPHIVRFALV